VRWRGVKDILPPGVTADGNMPHVFAWRLGEIPPTVGNRHS
jgi:hypothetical protein